MASKMFDIARQQMRNNGNLPLFFESNDDSLPFNFDSDLCRTGAARDAGFSADTLGLKSNYRPLLELLAFVAFQRFQPAEANWNFHLLHLGCSSAAPSCSRHGSRSDRAAKGSALLIQAVQSNQVHEGVSSCQP